MVPFQNAVRPCSHHTYKLSGGLQYLHLSAQMSKRGEKHTTSLRIMKISQENKCIHYLKLFLVKQDKEAVHCSCCKTITSSLFWLLYNAIMKRVAPGPCRYCFCTLCVQCGKLQRGLIFLLVTDKGGMMQTIYLSNTRDIMNDSICITSQNNSGTVLKEEEKGFILAV